MQWYYSKNGAQFGPIGDQEIKAKVASGEIASTDLVWREGMGDWMAAGQVADLRVPAAGGGVLATDFGSSPSNAPASPVVSAASPTPTYRAMPPSQGMAIGSLVCGIIGLLGCCMWCLSGPLAIVAIVLGHVALSKIKANPAAYTGKGKAQAGLIMGYLGLFLTIVVTVAALWLQTLSPQKLEELGVPPELRDQLIQQRAGRQIEMQ